MTESVQEFRRQVKAARSQLDLTQRELADRAGVSRGSVQNLENGMRLDETTESKIERALGKPIGWFEELRAGRPADPAPHAPPPPPFNPETATVGDVAMEFAYFAGKLSREDFERLVVFMNTFARLQQRPPSST